ncbi:MAG: transcriptional regulator [Deltaproteobacteria bacterium]|nr:MAG: transcriptional regulator [Desulfobacterales bacterium]PIE72194.1 MAG: transcriptional regulator [Deltaproteobacteria bacterium]
MSETKKELIEILAGVTDEAQMEGLLVELLTPREMKDIALRWQILKDLYLGGSQRQIAARHGMSLCKITRGSKQLKKKNSFTLKLLENLYKGAER